MGWYFHSCLPTSREGKRSEGWVDHHWPMTLSYLLNKTFIIFQKDWILTGFLVAEHTEIPGVQRSWKKHRSPDFVVGVLKTQIPSGLVICIWGGEQSCGTKSFTLLPSWKVTYLPFFTWPPYCCFLPGMFLSLLFTTFTFYSHSADNNPLLREALSDLPYWSLKVPCVFCSIQHSCDFKFLCDDIE